MNDLIARIENLEKQIAEKENELQLLKDDLEAIRTTLESALEELRIPEPPLDFLAHGSKPTPIVEIQNQPEHETSSMPHEEKEPPSPEQQHEAIMRTIEEFSKDAAPDIQVKRAPNELQTLGEKAGLTKLNDLRKAFAINERFLFANELFGGDMEAFTRAIEELNHLESLGDAERLLDENLANKYKWNEESESVIAFKSAISRRFS